MIALEPLGSFLTRFGNENSLLRLLGFGLRATGDRIDSLHFAVAGEPPASTEAVAGDADAIASAANGANTAGDVATISNSGVAAPGSFFLSLYSRKNGAGDAGGAAGAVIAPTSNGACAAGGAAAFFTAGDASFPAGGAESGLCLLL